MHSEDFPYAIGYNKNWNRQEKRLKSSNLGTYSILNISDFITATSFKITVFQY